MARVLYLDPFSGVAGDMFVGALLDLGLDLASLHHGLSTLEVKGYHLSSKKVMRGAMAATKFDVAIDAAVQVYRDYAAIVKLIENSGLSARVKRDSLAAFAKLAQAEARIHNMPLEKVHFHEVGAVDSIVDMVGACLGLELLGIDELHCGPVALGGGGFVQCDHGLMPVPAPATLEMMRGVPVRPVSFEKELTTPTGAALVAALARFGPLPAMNITALGYGAGTREQQPMPNVLRAVLGELESAAPAPVEARDTVLEIRTNIDDVSGEVLGHVSEALLAAGALDVFATPAQMKKNRPATVLTVLAEPRDLARLAGILFRETGTFGLRYSEQQRLKLERRTVTVRTPFGEVRVKVGRWEGADVSAHPEYEDCKACAERHGAPLRDVIAAARAALPG